MRGINKAKNVVSKPKMQTKVTEVTLPARAASNHSTNKENRHLKINLKPYSELSGNNLMDRILKVVSQQHKAAVPPQHTFATWRNGPSVGSDEKEIPKTLKVYLKNRQKLTEHQTGTTFPSSSRSSRGQYALTERGKPASGDAYLTNSGSAKIGLEGLYRSYPTEPSADQTSCTVRKDNNLKSHFLSQLKKKLEIKAQVRSTTPKIIIVAKKYKVEDQSYPQILTSSQRSQNEAELALISSRIREARDSSRRSPSPNLSSPFQRPQTKRSPSPVQAGTSNQLKAVNKQVPNTTQLRCNTTERSIKPKPSETRTSKMVTNLRLVQTHIKAIKHNGNETSPVWVRAEC